MILINDIYRFELHLIQILLHKLKSVLAMFLYKSIDIEDFDHISIRETGALEVNALHIYTHAHMHIHIQIIIYNLYAELKCQQLSLR